MISSHVQTETNLKLYHLLSAACYLQIDQSILCFGYHRCTPPSLLPPLYLLPTLLWNCPCYPCLLPMTYQDNPPPPFWLAPTPPSWPCPHSSVPLQFKLILSFICLSKHHLNKVLFPSTSPNGLTFPHQLPTTTVPPKLDSLFRQRARKKYILKHFQPVALKQWACLGTCTSAEC